MPTSTDFPREVASAPARSSKNNKPKVKAILFPLFPPTVHTDTRTSEEGLGVENAPGRTEGLDKNPGSAKVASDSGSTNVGVDVNANNPGEKGISGVPVDSEPEGHPGNMK